MNNRFIVKKPIISEKSTELAKFGKYVFMVDKKASSDEIKKAIKKIYDVDAVRINIINAKPRFGRYGRITTKKRSDFKKAVITLRNGQSIDIIPT